jgi:hypothetical protein
VNAPADRTSVGLIHPLEASVLSCNLDSLAALMEAGANETMEPTRDWSGSKEWSWSRKGPIENFLTFIWARGPNPALGPLMVAMVAEATMQRRIDQAEPATLDASPSARRRADRRL